MELCDLQNSWKNISPERWAEIEENVAAAEAEAMAKIGNTPEQLAKWKLIKNSSLSQHEVEKKTLDTYKPENDTAKEALRRFQAWEPHSNNGTCFGYFVYGPVGTGKTHLTKGLLIKWAATGRTCKFTTVAELMDEIKGAMNRDSKISVLETIQKYADYDILALDDFGAERTTEFTQEKFLSILETRLRIGRPTFVTSNLIGEDLKSRYDIRILDRLRELFLFLQVTGASYRAKIHSDRKQDHNNEG